MQIDATIASEEERLRRYIAWLDAVAPEFDPDDSIVDACLAARSEAINQLHARYLPSTASSGELGPTPVPE